MRYLILTYYRKASGQIDEAMTVSKKLKLKDTQTANVILDFKDCRVIRCAIDGTDGVKDWDTVVAYYYRHYANIIERLFNENGHAIPAEEPKVSTD